jgi:hypothetical protein
VLGGAAQGQNLIKTQPDQEDWSTAQMVRYPNRRTFLKLLSDPSYAPLEPYKFMALEIDLVPVSGDKVIPDARLIVGGALLTLFTAMGRRRAARR